MASKEDKARELRSKKLSVKYLKEEIAYMENKLEEYEADIEEAESEEYPTVQEYGRLLSMSLRNIFKKYSNPQEERSLFKHIPSRPDSSEFLELLREELYRRNLMP